MKFNPESFNKPERIVNNFSVHEAGNEGDELSPVLYYERNGDQLKVTLDLPGNTFEIEPLTFKDESSDDDINRVCQEVAGLADAELDNRRQELGNMFA